MNLREALKDSGVVEVVRQQEAVEKQAAELARKERNANLQPHQRWWQNFRMTVTAQEIPVFIKVECEKWIEGLGYIQARNLNKLTTRCKTREEAVDQLLAKIVAWQNETVLVAGETPPAGALLYWRIYE